jgi:two-component system phosphate regulon sensor histidine kinase PhoR
MPRRFFWRLFLAWMFILGAALAAVALVSVDRLQVLQFESRKLALLQESRLVYGLIRQDLHAQRLAQLHQEVARLGAATESRLTVIDAEGRVLADNSADPSQMENHRLRPEIVAAAAHGVGEAVRSSHTLQEEMLYLATRNDEPGGPPTYVRLAVPLAKLEAGLSRFDSGVVSALAAALLAGALAGGWVARRLSRPVAELGRFAEALARGETSARIHVSQPGEPAALARTLNQIAESLAAARSRAAQEQEEVRAILESMSDGLVAADAQQHVLLLNPAAAEMLALSPVPKSGEPLWNLVRQEALLKAADGVAATGQPATVRWVCARGRHLEATLLPLRRQTPPNGLLLVIRDVTRDVQYQELRKEFVANVSHELRTPLTVIRGYLETLRGGAWDDKPKASEYLATVEKHVRQLANLVDDLLEISRLENYALLPGQTAVNLPARIASVVEFMTPAARAKAQTLTSEVPDGLPLLLGNPEYLERAISNLVDNAIKYTPERGTIRLAVEKTGDRVVLSVTDNGIGIPEQDLPRIFERFYRVDKSRSRELGGTGLGLAIVKHIALAHGGTVEVQSKPGTGSTFRLSLPIRPA